MKHNRERNVMMTSTGKKLKLYPAKKTSWPENITQADMGHDDEQPSDDVSPKVADLDEAIQSEENGK